MKKSQFISLSLFAVAAMAASGCNDGQNASAVPDQSFRRTILQLFVQNPSEPNKPATPKNTDTVEDYQKASCEYQYEEGGGVDSTIAATPDMQTVYFGKQFDAAPVRAVMHASARATIDYFNTQNVHIFRTDASTTGCSLFGSLDAAPADFMKYWNSAATAKSGQKMSLIGLYAEKGNSQVPSTEMQPEIGVREDAYRWVVVHEFMHHQFQTVRAQGGITDSMLKDSLQNDLNDFQAKGSVTADQLDAQSALAMAQSLVKLLREDRELTIRYQLEEVTNETYLQVHYKEFDYMPMLKSSSDAYILTSAQAGYGDLDSLADGAAQVSQQLSTHGYHDAATLLAAEVQANHSLEKEVLDTVKLSGQSPCEVDPNLAECLNSQPVLGQEVEQPSADKPTFQMHCAREHEVDDLVEKIKTVLKQAPILKK